MCECLCVYESCKNLIPIDKAGNAPLLFCDFTQCTKPDLWNTAQETNEESEIAAFDPFIPWCIQDPHRTFIADRAPTSPEVTGPEDASRVAPPGGFSGRDLDDDGDRQPGPAEHRSQEEDSK